MGENDSFYDIFFIFHPVDIEVVRRVAAQASATGVNCRFDEDEFGKTDAGVKTLQGGILRSYTVAFALSPASAESQLCNALLQYAVGNGKRVLTLILDDDIDVEVHPSIAQNPYVFLRAGDDLGARVEELRAYLPADDNLKLHTELLVLANIWRDRGRPPDLLLPPDRLEEARGWLATASARHPKPSPLQVEFIHTSRRGPPKRRPPAARRVALALALLIALGAGLLLLARVVGTAQFTGALTSEAQTQAATVASEGALGLIDNVAATSVSLRAAAARTATAESISVTAAAQVTATAQAQVDMRATDMRATQVAQLERDEVARRLVLAGEEALAQGDVEKALALAWEAKDGLDDPGAAYRLLRRAAAAKPAQRLDAFYTLRFQPGGARFALVPQTYDGLKIYDARTGTLLQELTDHEHPITAMEYSRDGRYLVTAASDGEIIIRDSNTGAIQHRLSAHQDAVTSIAAFPHSDRLVSAGRLPHLALWDLNDGEKLAEFALEDAPQRQFGGLLVSADEARVIGLSSDGGNWITVQWSADALELLPAESDERDYRGYDRQGQIGYTGGRSFPAYPGDPNAGDVQFWDLGTGELIARLNDGFNWSLLSGGDLTAAIDELLFISFQEESALLVIRTDAIGQWAALVDIGSGRLLRRIENEIAASLKTAELLSDGSVLSATEDDRVILWSSADGSLIREIANAPEGIEQLRLSPAGDLIFARTNDGAAHLRPFRDAAAEPLLMLTDAMPGTTISPSGAALLHVEDDGIRLKDVDSNGTLAQIQASAVSSAGARFAAYEDGELRLYDGESGAEIHSWNWDGDALTALRLAPAGDLLLALTETNELWLARHDAEQPQQLARQVPPPSLIRFSPGGETALTLLEDLALLWDTETPAALGAYPLDAPADADLQAAFRQDGDGIVFFLQLEGGLAGLTALELADNIPRRQTFIEVESGALSADGETLALAFQDGRVHVLSTESGDILAQLPAGAGEVRKLRYLPAENALITASGVELILWDLAAGAIDQRFAHPAPVLDFHLSRDGRRILTLDGGGTYRLWQVESAEELLARIAENHAPRGLTCAEREQYSVAPLCE